jgi:outer membrane protein OmpA-like peptidoglycan-associated protein/outer membrane protein W
MSKQLKLSTLIAALGVFLVTPLLAQQKGTWEIGGFARYNWYDQSFDQSTANKRKNSWGGGARVGYFFSDRFSLELDGSGNATDVDGPPGTSIESVGLVYMPFHLRALYNGAIGETSSWILGAGLNYNRYRTSSAADAYLKKTYEGSDFGVGALAGFRLGLNDVWSLRVDGTMDYIPSPQSDVDGSNTMLGLQAGLSAFLGGKCTDKLDSIAVEPRNSTVMVGDPVNLTVRGYLCDGSSTNVTSASTGSASGGTLTGASFSSNTPGSYTVTYTNAMARKLKSSSATVTVNARPIPPVTLTRVDLQPDQATISAGESVALRVVGQFSDGSSRPLTNCRLTPDAGTVSNGSFSATRAGEYTITANCDGGQTDRSRITVQSISFTVRALFEFNKTNVYVQAERDSLKALAQLLKANPNMQLTIQGHTDWVGSVGYNEKLGMRRIEAVLEILKAEGVSQAQLDAFTKNSFGECQPIASNATNGGRAQNRRVEVTDPGSATQYVGTATCPNRP